MSYVAFNIKTDYSLLNSLIKVDDLISFCLANKLDKCAICDNNLSSSIEFYNKCTKNKIKPLIGLEVMYDDNKLYLYAENYIGYKNLLKINTLKEKDTMSKESLIKYSNYIICILPYNSIDLFHEFKFYKNIFVGYKNDHEKKNALILTSNTIFCNEVKVFRKEDINYLEYLNELGGYNSLTDNNWINQIDDKEVSELDKLFSIVDLRLNSTEKYIPKYNDNSKEYLKLLAHKGLEKRLGKISGEYITRLEYELDVINDMGFTDYFLIVYDYVLYTKKNKILVGPGRGSAAGSLVCYSIGITDIDPIKYDLLFERFLNKDRISMPDIDIDFDSEKREEIINYVKNKYGYESVATGITYSTLKPKLVLRDIGKILKIDNILLDKFIKNIDRFNSLKDNLNNPVIKKYLDNYDEFKNLYKICIRLENLKKNYSTHAAGIVICSKELDDVIPIKIDNEVIKAAVPMEYMEDLGILKMDFLGLKNLTIISNVLEKIDKNLLKDINLNDEKVISIFKDVKTDGIFQYETFAMKELLKKLKPNNFDEIVAAVALVRPGPSEFLDDYIKNKNGNISYFDDNLKDILKETYGIILYQEQIIKIMMRVGNFSATDADLVRRAISKKKKDSFEEFRTKFIDGAIKNNYSTSKATLIFEKILRFAGYGFNKSHSVAYALIAYQMAYLKVYYENEFMNELLSGSKDQSLSENFLVEMKNNGVSVFKPDVNYSKKEYFLKDNKLVLPLSMIKSISSDAESNILENAPYTDLFDFVLKNKNIKDEVLENLIYAGALRSLKLNTKMLINGIDVARTYADLNGFGDKPVIIYEDDFEESYLKEKELLLYGFYIGNHPASKYKDKNITKIINIENKLFNNITCVVMLEKYKKIKTKKGDDMAFVSVSDETGKKDFLIFKENISILDNIKNNTLVSIHGKVSKSYDKISVIINSIQMLK